MPPDGVALLVYIDDGLGVLHELTGVIAGHGANIAYVDITDRQEGRATLYFELEDVGDAETLVTALAALPVVREISQVDLFQRVYGKRIIVIDRKSTRLNSSHIQKSRMPSSA